MKIIGLIVIYFFSITAYAAPVYLDCTMTNGTKDALWQITLDEANSTVSYTIPSMGVVQKKAAVFTSDKVLFDSMEISRVDFSFKREFFGQIDTGQCKFATTSKRKF